MLIMMVGFSTTLCFHVRMPMHPTVPAFGTTDEIEDLIVLPMLTVLMHHYDNSDNSDLTSSLSFLIVLI